MSYPVYVLAFASFTQKIFKIWPVYYLFTPTDVAVPDSLCFYIFPPKTLQNFCITFDITSSKKWNPDKIFKNIMLSAALGAGWCHDVPKRCFSDRI